MNSLVNNYFFIYFGKVIANQKIHVPTIFAKVGHVTRQNYNGRNSDVSLYRPPQVMGWRRVIFQSILK